MSSARETFKRRSKRQDQSDRPVTQTDFSGALVKNAPHDEIPPKALAGLINAHAFPTEIVPRFGTRLINFTVPSIKTGITASKAGTIITSSGFTEDDVSNYFVWPDENVHDEIIEYISDTQIRVHRSNTKSDTAGCWMHGRLNLWEWHQSQRKMVWQWGERVYVNEISLSGGFVILSSLVEALCVSRERPTNVISDWSEMDDFGVIYNSNGTFLVEFDTPTIFKKNTPVPSSLPDDVERSTDSKRRYDVSV